MRIIDADALKRHEQKIATQAWKMQVKASVETILNQFIDDIDHAPTVDAVEVVRCKDCRHWSGRKYNVHINGFLPWCGFSALQREANDYCSYGERKDGEQP